MTRKLFLAMIFAALPAAAQSGLTGNWSGTYTASIQLSACQNKTFTWSGNAGLSLLQAGSTLQGRLDLTNFTFFNSNCTTTSAELTKVFFGTTTDGSTVTLAVPNDPNGWQLSGPLTALQLADPNGLTGSFTLSRTAATPSADFTGSWSGTYNFTDVCPNGSSKKSYTGNFALALTQTGQNAAGVLAMTSVPLYDQNCTTIVNLTQTMSVAGSVSGSTFTGAAFDVSGAFDFPFTATIGSSGISGTAAGASPTSTTGTFNLTQSSPQIPASDFSGQYSGTYAETDNGQSFCFNIGNVNFGDVATVSLIQAGNTVSGALILENTLAIVSDGFGNCGVVDGGEQVLPFYGTLANGTVSLTVPIAANAVQVLTFNLSGDAITGAMQDSFGDVMQFSVTRSTTPTPPPGARRRAVKP